VAASDDNNEDLKARIQELEDELQKLKDQKRQEYADTSAVDEEIEEVHDQIRDEAENSGMSRRKFMKAIAGGGAALGAAAMMPSAAALDIESNNPLSYNDNFSVDTQGNLSGIGSVDASSIDTDDLGGKYPKRVRAIGQSGVVSSIDPSTTTTPVSDAAQALRDAPGEGWSGYIILPPGGVDNDSSVTLDGYGGFISPGPGAGEIRFTSDTKGLILGAKGHTSIKGGLKLTGPGWNTGTEPAIYSNVNNARHVWDYIATEDWGGQSLLNETEPLYFLNVGLWHASKHDPARNTDTSHNYVYYHDSGVSNSFGTIILANGETVPSGTTPAGLRSGTWASIGTLEVLGDIGSNDFAEGVMNIQGGSVSVGFVNHEGLTLSVPETKHYFNVNDGALYVDHARTNRDVETGTRMYQPRGGRIPKIAERGGSVIGNHIALAKEPINRSVKYDGEQSEILDNSGSTGWEYGIEAADGYLKQ